MIDSSGENILFSDSWIPLYRSFIVPLYYYRKESTLDEIFGQVLKKY